MERMLRLLIGFVMGSAVAAMLALLPGCGGADESAGTSGTEYDSGYPEDATDGTTGDSTAPDSGLASDGPSEGSADGGGPATIAFVHASPDLPAVRLCWTAPGSQQAMAVPAFPADNLMPASDYPGIPVGGAAWGTFPSNLADLNGGTVYAVSASNIAGNTHTCDRLICNDPGCVASNDYWSLGTIAPGVLNSGPNVVAIAGCRGDDRFAGNRQCGEGWQAGSGNLHLQVLPVGYAPGRYQGLLTVQAAQLSPGLVWLQGDAGMSTVSFGAESAPQPFAQLASSGDVEPSLPQMLSLDAGAVDQLGFAVDVAGADASDAGHFWMSLSQALALTDPQAELGTYYAFGGIYVVAIVGDPTASLPFSSDPDASYDGTGLHLLVVSTAVPAR
jgi:hypothetical protein